MKVKLVKPTGIVIERPTGISWTTFFFGFFPAMFRADWKYALIMLVAAGCTFGLSGFLFMFKYNKWHLEDLIAKGCKAADESSHLQLINIDVISPTKPFESPIS